MMPRPVDARLSRSSGAPVSLSVFRGKPAVLFYEDRYSTERNQALKDRLFELGKSRNLLDAVNVIAIANLQGWNFFPARDFALVAVRGFESKFKIPILVDFEGVMSSDSPLLPEKDSTVLLLDADGRILWQKNGVCSKAEVDALLDRLQVLVGRPSN